MSLLINHFNKWGFVHIPKTGGTTISTVLKQDVNTELIDSHDSINRLSNIDNYYIFSCVRNPFTRLASTYYHECRKTKQIPFSKFLKGIDMNYILYLPQSYYLKTGKELNKNISYICRYENFLNDFKTVLSKLNILSGIPHLNRNPIYDRHPNLNQEQYYKFLYEEEWMKDWVRERYLNDFKIFNYDMDI